MPTGSTSTGGACFSEALIRDQAIVLKMHIDNLNNNDTNADEPSDSEHSPCQLGFAQPSTAAYRHFVSQSIQTSSRALAADWLKRLDLVVDENMEDIFPTEQYLDHIPSMIEQLGVILSKGDTELAMVNSIICHKALELGRLRHEQKATISQLLREYDLLARLLAEYQLCWINQFSGAASAGEILEVSDIVSSVIRLILQYTVDAFAERYMNTIKEQTDKLVTFNRFVGHEIRSPLNGALLGIDMLLESEGFTSQQTSDIDNVRRSLLEAASVVDSVEKLVSQSAPVTLDSPVRQALPLAPFLSDLCRQIADTLKTRGVTVHVSEHLGEVYLETGRLKLLLSNILSNAVKYSDPDKQQRQVWVTRHDHPDGSLELTVRDNGLGIPPDQLKKVMGLSVRAHAQLDDKHAVSGEGLGLYLVDEAMRELGGTVVLQSEPGEGTCVRLVFPAETH